MLTHCLLFWQEEMKILTMMARGAGGLPFARGSDRYVCAMTDQQFQEGLQPFKALIDNDALDPDVYPREMGVWLRSTSTDDWAVPPFDFHTITSPLLGFRFSTGMARVVPVIDGCGSATHISMGVVSDGPTPQGDTIMAGFAPGLSFAGGAGLAMGVGVNKKTHAHVDLAWNYVSLTSSTSERYIHDINQAMNKVCIAGAVSVKLHL